MTERPVVAVWSTHWLDPARTYIADHMRSLRRYRPWLVGRSHGEMPPGLPAPFAPFPSPSGSGLATRAYWKGLQAWQARGFEPLYGTVARRHRPSLVHAHFTHGGLVSARLALRLGVPLVISVRGDDVVVLGRAPAPGDNADDRALRDRWPGLVAATDLFLAPSGFMAERLALAGVPENRIRVHHLGATPPADEPPLLTERSGIVFVGRLAPIKGVDDLLDAVARLPGPLRRTPVRIVGTGPELERLRARARALDLDVTFTGRLDPASVAAEYRRARAFVACSGVADCDTPEPAEAFGQVNLEAAGAGLPAVVYGGGGVPDAVVHELTGLVIDVGDVDALSRGIAAVLADDVLGRRARARALGEMNITERTQELEKTYDTVVTGALRKERA